MRAVRVLVLCAGGAFSAVMVVGAIHGRVLPANQAIAAYGVAAFSAITIGLVTWELRPESRTGILVAAIPFAGMLNDLNVVFRSSRLAETIGWGASYLAAPLIAWVVLGYPSGRLTSRLHRICVAAFWALAAAYALLFMLFYSPRSPFDEQVWTCPSCAVPYTHVAWLNLIATNRALDKALLALALVALALLAWKVVRAAPGARPVVLPLTVAAAFIVVQFGVQIALYGHSVDSWTHPTWFWIVTAAPLSIPVALALGLLWGGGGRGPVPDLVVELERTPPGSVRDALARTLGDPSLEIALWLPERATYVDADGREVCLPAPESGRAVTVLGRADAPVAALVHDPVLLERRGLLAAAGAATRLALENERLQAELRAQLAELRASRTRIVTAGDEERRRLERDLHDGAQQRLLSLGLALQLVRAELGPDANGAAPRLGVAEAELAAALDELRQLAQGIHPAVLTEHGLGPALKTLAARAPLPVEIERVPDARLPAPVEAAAYFVVSEALANAAKHSHASAVSVWAACEAGALVVEVGDDGVGGVAPRAGSGLTGLADRVLTLDGRLTIDSQPGAGTRLRAEFPCAVVAKR
jgi:signal transduction histidine kinase